MFVEISRKLWVFRLKQEGEVLDQNMWNQWQKLSWIAVIYIENDELHPRKALNKQRSNWSALIVVVQFFNLVQLNW